MMNISTTNQTSSTPPRLSSSLPRAYFSTVPLNEHHNDFLLAFITINGFISPVSFCINLVIIATISMTASLRTSSNILLLGLAASDFCTSFITQPSYCWYLFAEYKRDASLFLTVRYVYVTSNTMLAMVTLFSLTAITGDRFLAVRLHLRYQEFVTPRRCCILLVSIWVCSALTSIGRMIFDGLQISLVNYILAIILIPLVLVLNGFFMVSISKAMRRHSAQIHAQQSSIEQQSLNMPRLKKSVKTMIFVIGAFLFSYVPLIAFVIAFVLVGKWSQEIRSFLVVAETVIMMNGIINPIIYCWRISELRNALKGNVRRAFAKLCVHQVATSEGRQRQNNTQADGKTD